MFKAIFFIAFGITTNILCMEYEIKTYDDSEIGKQRPSKSKSKKSQEISKLRATPKNGLKAAIFLGRIDLIVQLFDKELITLKEFKKPEQLLLLALKAEKNSVGILNFLIKKGINLNNGKSNPLAQACSLYCNQNSQEQRNRKNEIFEIIKCLLANGADADLALSNAISKNEITLSYLIKNNATKIIALLLNYLEDKEMLNAFDQDMTPLMYSAENGNLEIFELLCASGADIEIINRQQYCALDYALQNKKFDIAKKILDLKLLSHRDTSYAEAIEIEITNLLQILSDLNITKKTKDFSTASFIVKYICEISGLKFLKNQLEINELADKYEKKESMSFLDTILHCNDIDQVLLTYDQKWILDNFFSDKP